MSTLRPEAAHQGHLAQKGRRGVWVPLALVRGRRLDQLLVQVGRGGPRPCEVGGNFQLKCGDDRIFVLLTERGARPCCLLDFSPPSCCS
jgi:hypothetical protein